MRSALLEPRRTRFSPPPERATRFTAARAALHAANAHYVVDALMESEAVLLEILARIRAGDTAPVLK